MFESIPSLSTDQVIAFVALVRHGSIRQAAYELGISEQGVRNRLIALEERFGVELYRKARGRRRATQLTQHGHQFIPHAMAFLERARDLCGMFGEGETLREVHVAASQYLTHSVLIDAIRAFRRKAPNINLRLTTLSDVGVENAVLCNPDIAFGVATPYDSSPALDYTELIEYDWKFIAPPRHSLLRHKSIRLEHIGDEPLILFESGSSGRQHIMDAFHALELSPRVATETTNTEIVVRMVEARLGVSIVPLLKNGDVTQGHRVDVRSLGRQVRRIHSGIMCRHGETLSGASLEFLEFVKRTKETDDIKRRRAND